MKNVLTEIAEWATGLPYWEQAALDKISSGKQLKEDDYQELLKYLLEDAGLEAAVSQKPALDLNQRLGVTQAIALPQKLIQITNLENVNALVTQQKLTFSPAMTAIYGANGSGKSGYVRVLGSAGFTRGDREVLPDITKPVDTNIVLSADIELSDGIIHYRIGEPCAQMASFYVFDSTSVRVHMCEQNPLSFSPTGLSYLKALADVTDGVRARLSDKITENTQPPQFINAFQGDSEVARLIANLGSDTDPVELQKLASLTPEEKKRLRELNVEIANAELDKFHAQIDSLREKVTALENFRLRMLDAQSHLSDQKVTELSQEIESYRRRVNIAQDVSIQEFKSKTFDQIGSEVWQNFIVAAKILADTEGKPDKPYPQPESHCLLCQQPLSENARKLILRLWQYLDSEAQSQLVLSLETLKTKQATLGALSLFDLTLDFSTPYKYLRELNIDLLDKVNILVQSYRERRDALVQAIDVRMLPKLQNLPEDCVPDIEKYLQVLKAQLQELESTNLEERVAELELQKRSLEHRELLSNMLPEVLEYVKKLIWAREAGKAGGSTRHITKMHNELFNELVTDRYLLLFEQTLKALGRPLKVKVQTKGRKGETLKQIVLEADQTAGDMAKPEKVLSEGEKRAVALADFLTEVALDTTSNGVILDDPVTSLDLNWRETIASILVDQAKERQVIIFTHDLPFLYFLKYYADQRSVERQTHWIKRGDVDDKPGYVYLNNSPALEREYRKPTRARDFHSKAKSASAAEQESFIREGLGALRASYEAFIIFDMFNEVVMRFDERISFGRLKDIVWDNSIANEVIHKCELLSKYIEGHLHSDAFGAVKPTPDLLMQEIEAFDALSNRLKQLRKSL